MSAENSVMTKDDFIESTVAGVCYMFTNDESYDERLRKIFAKYGILSVTDPKYVHASEHFFNDPEVVESVNRLGIKCHPSYPDFKPTVVKSEKGEFSGERRFQFGNHADVRVESGKQTAYFEFQRLRAPSPWAPYELLTISGAGSEIVVTSENMGDNEISVNKKTVYFEIGREHLRIDLKNGSVKVERGSDTAPLFPLALVPEHGGTHDVPLKKVPPPKRGVP